MEKGNGRRVILFPLPLQGCINPMLQLANILFSKGFSITVFHTRFNAPKPQKFPLFTFLQIPDGLSETQVKEAPTWSVLSLLVLINRNSESPFRELLAKLLQSEKNDERISCLIDDCGWLFTKSVADSFGLPRIVLSTFEATFLNTYPILPILRRKGYLRVRESEADDPIPEFPPLRKKDLLRILTGDEEQLDLFIVTVVETTKTSSGLIFMSCQELEQNSLSQSLEVFQVPIFPIGPFHSYFTASSSSLFTQDETCIPWLDKQEDESVIYVSLGSVATISESEFVEIAWGLSSCGQPFLWVVRPGSIRGAKWIESLPQGLMEGLNKRGKIVKWAPQQDVLAHRATGGFLTHNGLNSTLESLCEGVPMICLPEGWDQMINARLVSDLWRVGIHLEGRVDRNEMERAVRRLMVEPEGREIRDRVKQLKERVRKSIEPGGSSYQSLEDLVHHILAL